MQSKLNQSIEYKNSFPFDITIFNIKEYPWHYHHSDIHLIHVIKGSVKLKTVQFNYTMYSGDTHVVHTGDVHGFSEGTPDNQVLVLSFSTTYLDKIFPGFSCNIFSTILEDTEKNSQKKSTLNFLIYRLFFNFSEHKAEDLDLAQKAAYDFIIFFKENFRSYFLDENCILSSRSEYDFYQEERIRRIVVYLYQNYESKINLTYLAELENVNPFYLSHLIQRYTGKPFRELLGIFRSESAEALVLENSYSISKISSMVGFSNYTYFVKYFTQLFGYSPNEYRELFSKKIIGIAPIKSVTLPTSEYTNVKEDLYNRFGLTHMSPTIVNIKATKEISQSLDFSMPLLDFSLCNVPTASSSFDYSELHRNYLNSHTATLNILEGFFNHSKHITNLSLIDNAESTNGLFTYNGLRKPLYYLNDFLSQLKKHIVTKSNTYILTYDDNEFALLLMNPYDHKQSLKIIPQDFEFLNNMTILRLSKQKSFYSFFEQLGFPSSIRKEELDLINTATIPLVSFYNFNRKNTNIFTLELEPFEIALLKWEG